MKVHYRSGKLTVEIQAETTKELFAQIADIQGVFEADHSCGCCGGVEIVYVVREAADKKGKTYDYYEWVCRNPDCGAKLAFGQRLEGGGLFPKTWNAEQKRPYPNRGWKVWRKDNDGGGYQSESDEGAPY